MAPLKSKDNLLYTTLNTGSGILDAVSYPSLMADRHCTTFERGLKSPVLLCRSHNAAGSVWHVSYGPRVRFGMPVVCTLHIMLTVHHKSMQKSESASVMIIGSQVSEISETRTTCMLKLTTALGSVYSYAGDTKDMQQLEDAMYEAIALGFRVSLT